MQKVGLPVAFSNRFQYFASFVIPVLVAFAQFRFTPHNLSKPLIFENDENIYANQVFSLIHHFSLTNKTFGAPFGQDLNHAFFSVDMGPATIAALLSVISGNLYFGLNLALLLSFGLAGLFYYAAARLLRIDGVVSLLGAMIFALLPQHFVTGTGAFTVSNYFPIPLIMALFVLEVKAEGMGYSEISRKKKLALISFAIWFGSFYSYYSLGFILIACSYLVFSLLLGKFKINQILPMVKLVAWVVLGFFLSSIPSLIAVSKSSDGINYLRGRSY